MECVNVGRPSTLTPEVQAKIVEAVKAGNYKHVAAAYAGVPRGTFFQWMDRGRRQKTGRYKDFYDAITEAEAIAESNNVVTIALASKNDWKASAWLLERSKRTRWGAHISVDGMRELSDDQLLEIIAQLNERLQEEDADGVRQQMAEALAGVKDEEGEA